MLDEEVMSGGSGTAADAPASTAAAAPGAPAAPMGTQAAVDQARQRLAGEGSILPAAEAGAGEGGDEAGGEEGAGAEGAEETEEQKAAREAEEAAAGAGEGAEGAEETDEEKAAREAAEAAGAGTDEEHPELAITLPGMEERGEQDITLDAPDVETANRLRRQANEAALGRQVKQERRALERQYERLETIEDQIAMDPTGFVLDRVAEPYRAEVALQLILEPGVFEAVQERLAKAEIEGGLAGLLDNPTELRVQRAQLESSRLRMEKNLRTQADERRAMRANAQRVAAQVEKLIPETIVGEERERLYRETLKDVSDRCDRLGIRNLEDQDVQLFVGTRFRERGIAVAPVSGPKGNGKPAAKPPVPKARTAAQFTQAKDARQKAAAAAPAGAGAPAAKSRPTLPPTTDERISLARRVGLRTLLGKR